MLKLYIVRGDIMKQCVLDLNKICDDCGKCNYCDIDPTKICDNCMKCVTGVRDFISVKIDEVQTDKEKIVD